MTSSPKQTAAAVVRILDIIIESDTRDRDDASSAEYADATYAELHRILNEEPRPGSGRDEATPYEQGEGELPGL